MKILLIPMIALAALSACNKPAAPPDPKSRANSADGLGNLVDNGAAIPAPAPTDVAAAAEPVALEPLTEGDSGGLEPGCFCAFSTGTDKLLEIAAAKAVLRIGGNLKTCAITQEQSSALTGGDGEFTCEGYDISLKGEGEIQRGGEETFGRDGILTISSNGQTRSYKGGMGCQC